ncbi:MAG: prolyl oligopeptidase family serine peptidase [Zavarzinella sp.]
MQKKTDDELPYGFEIGEDGSIQQFDANCHEIDFDKPPKELKKKLKAERKNQKSNGWKALFTLIGVIVLFVGLLQITSNKDHQPIVKDEDPEKLLQNQIAQILLRKTPLKLKNYSEEKKSIMPQLSVVRHEFKTRLISNFSSNIQTPIPPKGVLELVKYSTSLGVMDAYITPKTRGPGRYPAIIWLSDQLNNSIDQRFWSVEQSHLHGQTFRDAGLIMMYPSMRGGNKNPGFVECGFGEVDDILDACKFLTSRDDVDRSRIFLVGHGYGGTLALLTAEYRSTGIRGVLAIAPASSIDRYDREKLTYDATFNYEKLLRSPSHWMNHISCSTWIVTGKNDHLWSTDLNEFKRTNLFPERVHCSLLPDLDHQSIVEPVVRVYLGKIKELQDPSTPLIIQNLDDMSVEVERMKIRR